MKDTCCQNKNPFYSLAARTAMRLRSSAARSPDTLSSYDSDFYMKQFDQENSTTMKNSLIIPSQRKSILQVETPNWGRRYAWRAILVVSVLLCVAVSALRADGVLRPTDAAYPGDFLRLRMTNVNVSMMGQIATTTVYQEFVNEWNKTTNAVYSFPLPADARATRFLYWSNDTCYEAILKPQEQAVNPGTGSGGIDADLNKYLGTNGLRVLLTNIPAGKLQRIQLEYLAVAPYYEGKVTYRYPLNTSQFVLYPVESFSFTMAVTANDNILSYSVKEFSQAVAQQTDQKHLRISIDQSKIYLAKDVTVSYATVSDSMTVDFYAVANDTADGHFALILKPQVLPDSASIMEKNVVFLVDCSANASGQELDAAKAAVTECLKRLQQGDAFNVVAFNSNVSRCFVKPVLAISSNIAAAQTFVQALYATGSPGLQNALTTVFSTSQVDSLSNSIILFSDGRSTVDPKVILNANALKTGIFPISVGDNVDRRRMELLAYMNYGFPTFLAFEDPVADEAVRVLTQLAAPILKDSRLEVGANVYDLLPGSLQTVYAGSRFFLTGRYKNAGISTLSLGGYSAQGARFYNFALNFPTDRSANKFVEKLWAKEKIDALERQIAVYGETDSLKKLDIAISLGYRIRCKYTAYIADRSVIAAGVDDADVEIADFRCSKGSTGNILRWTIAHTGAIREIHMYRRIGATGGFVRINDAAVTGSIFIDASTPSGDVYYRMELVLSDGKRIMSSIISAMPLVAALDQNFPNPFNPTTTIRFAVPEKNGPSAVSIVIYDVLGREIRTLIAGEEYPGYHEVVWNGRDNSGSQVASGFYVCRFAAGSFAQIRTMVLMK